MAREPNPRRVLTPELTPLAPYAWWRRVAVRAGQALRFDVRGRRAWQRAAAGPQDGMGGGRAVHLARAGVPCRAPTQWHDDTVNTAWVEALGRNSPASVAAWLLALPVSLAAQRWRNRALWQAARLDAPRVFLTVLRGGADVRSRDDNVSRYHNDKADAPLISFLLKDEEYDDDRAPRRLAKMAMLVERGCGINEGVLRQRRMGRFSPLELRRLRELGMTLDTDRLSVRWLTPLLTDAVGRTPGTLKPLRALLRAEARPNARNDEGDPLLHVLLLLTHRCCEDSGQAEMRALYTALVQAGADPTSTSANGDTPTPQCPPRTLRPRVPARSPPRPGRGQSRSAGPTLWPAARALF